MSCHFRVFRTDAKRNKYMYFEMACLWWHVGAERQLGPDDDVQQWERVWKTESA